VVNDEAEYEFNGGCAAHSSLDILSKFWTGESGSTSDVYKV